MTSGEADLAISQAAQTAPADRTNTSETYAQMMQILSETGAVYDYTTMLKGAVDLNEVIENVYAGTYATGEEAAAAFDAMY